MIQLANDPNAGRPGFRPVQPERKGYAYAARQGRTSGHAWPFPSQYAGLPTQQDDEKNTGTASGS